MMFDKILVFVVIILTFAVAMNSNLRVEDENLKERIGFYKNVFIILSKFKVDVYLNEPLGILKKNKFLMLPQSLENYENLEHRGNLPVVNLKVINATIDEDLIFQSYGCQEILIQHANSPIVLKQIEEKIKLHRDRFNFRKYLIVSTLKPSENLTQIFHLQELQYIVNLLVVIPVEDKDSSSITRCELKFNLLCEHHEIFKLITHRYVGKNNNNQPELLDLWFSKNQSFRYGNNLYPDKISNQQGRILRCATFNYKPYSIIGESPSLARGSENCVAHEYAQRHNMTVEYILDDNEWGIIYENWTGDGILGNLAMDKADVGYGALYTWEHEYGFLDLSKPTLRTGITCLVPAPSLAAGWLTPLFPFSAEMWVGTGISFILASIVVIGLTIVTSKQQLTIKCGHPRWRRKRTDYKKVSVDSFMAIFGILLIQPLPSTKKAFRTVLRHMFIIFLFALLLTSSYSSGLASVMTIPRYEDSIETVFDLANSGLQWGATQNAWIFSIMAEERPQYVILVDRFVATSQENLIEKAKTNHFAFSVERLPSGQYAIGNYVTKDSVRKLRLMHEDLYWEYCLFMLHKSSPLLDSLDNYLLQVAQAGLINFWEMNAAETHMDVRVQNIVKYYTTVNRKKQGDTSTAKLKWVHVEGAFGILIIGCGIAGLCFIIEIMIYKHK